MQNTEKHSWSQYADGTVSLFQYTSQQALQWGENHISDLNKVTWWRPLCVFLNMCHRGVGWSSLWSTLTKKKNMIEIGVQVTQPLHPTIPLLHKWVARVIAYSSFHFHYHLGTFLDYGTPSKEMFLSWHTHSIIQLT